jgi:peptidoglycan/LPS O-acetylase OafA/YrhL
MRAAPARPCGKPQHRAPPPSWTIRILWTALAACASTLLLAISNHLSQNVAPIPFLWVLPLAVYLLSFILCFERDKVYNRGVFLPLLVIALDGAAYAIYANEGNPNIAWAIPTFVAALFVCCMVCHGELARLKPDPRHLTSFYMMISLGGTLGGVFVAIVAPRVFHTYFELPLVDGGLQRAGRDGSVDLARKLEGQDSGGRGAHRDARVHGCSGDSSGLRKASQR